MQQQDNRKILIISVAAATFIVMVVAILIQSGVFSRAPQHKTQDAIGNGLAPETSLQQTAPVFVGFDNLVANGVTLDQVNALQTAFQRYQPLSAANTVIDASSGTLIPIPPNSSDPEYRPAISTTVVVNQKTIYTIKFYYWQTSKIQLLIYDTTGRTLLFDSGTVIGNS